MKYYIEMHGTVVPIDDVIEWAQWFETAHRIVAQFQEGDTKVSTVFLGIDHNFGDGPPLIYETMVFGGPHDGEMDRYATRAEAEKGHQRMVEFVKESRKPYDEQS